jgi:adenylate cyclase
MTHMALKRVPPSIRQSSAITRLDISCNRIVDLEHAGLHEISTLVSLKVQNNRLTTLPASFSELKSLKYLNISNNKFVEFPTVICSIHNLVDLDVSFNEINALPSELCKLASLERLVAVGNSLVTFPNSFSSLASLRELDVRRNSLTNLNAVYTLPNLAILQADHNNLVVLDAQLGPKVREFGMPHNSITRFTLAPLSTNATAYSLSVLDLSYAKLSTLADDALAQLVNLQTLNLNYNKFVRLPSTLENLENLRHLSCTDNVLTELPGGIGKLYNLQVLNVHNNNLKELPAGIWQCKDLRTLNASSNLLENFPETPFSMLDALAMPPGISRKDSSISQTDKQSGGLPLSKSLRNLMLCDNQLDEEVFESVSMLEELRVLNLSFNDIYEVPTWTISKNQRLEELYLSGNNLTSLPAEDLERLTSLRIIHVNGNKLQTLPAELGKIRKLTTLDVGSNVLKYNIANWPYDWNWNWNLELRYLNLSGNKRLEIKPSVQHDTGYNGAFRRDLSDFSKLSHIRVLGLMDVTLRIPSLPDESEQRRVRTSFSDLNGMGYGISDTLGRIDNLSMLDLVMPDFRSKDDECLFGMFGLAIPTLVGGRVPRFVQEWLASNFHAQLEKLKDTDTVADALRRTFLLVNKNCFDSLMAEENSRKDSSGNGNTNGGPLSSNGTYTPLSHQYRSGASGAVIYMTGRTLHVANAGRILAVISCKGEAELLSAKHDPFDKEETQRIRAAEAWVSPRGLVNDEVPLARGFGFYNAVPAVNSLPHVTKREITDADEFVILANRALWDCCSYQTAVDIARTVKDNPMLAAQKLRDFAISYGAEGSIMIMVLSVADLFRHRPIRSRTMLMDKESAVDGEGYHAATKRVARRRIEDIGDRTLLRLQQEVEPPIGQVAMVFTDIKNSTSLWETNPGMQTAMRMHNSLLRRQLRIIGGYEVKTEGDAFIVSFPSVTSAILWCFTCQLQLLTEDWPREILECSDGREVFDSYGELIARGLSVRMGIHWGNPVWEKDPITRRMDYFGPMVNKSARVSASADGGQIMVSSDVHKEVQLFKTYLDAEDEDDLKELQDDVRRETIQLRKIGLGVLAMGEKKLKGLEGLCTNSLLTCSVF